MTPEPAPVSTASARRLADEIERGCFPANGGRESTNAIRSLADQLDTATAALQAMTKERDEAVTANSKNTAALILARGKPQVHEQVQLELKDHGLRIRWIGGSDDNRKILEKIEVNAPANAAPVVTLPQRWYVGVNHQGLFQQVPNGNGIWMAADEVIAAIVAAGGTVAGEGEAK